MNRAFVPRPILKSAGSHVYRRGQTPQTIAGLYGQPASSYRDLVAVNHRKPLTLAGVPAGSSATFRTLSDGEQLRLPWFWFAGKNARNAGLVSGGTVGDVQQDDIAAAITAIFMPSMKTPEAIAALPALVNTIGLWWRQDHAGGGVPQSAQDVVPYSKSSTSWWNNIGSKISPAAAATIPWNEVPFRALAIFQAASGIELSAINWGVINDYLEKNVPLGMFPVSYTAIDFKQPIDFTGKVPGTNGSWGNIPWNVLGEVRWDLLPLSYLDTSGAPLNINAQTDWLLNKIKAAVAAKTPSQSGPPPVDDVAPLPSATPPDCSKIPGGGYPEKLPNGQYTGLCIACGKNAHIAADGFCDCNPGFQLDPANPNSPDCVPVVPPISGGCPVGQHHEVLSNGAVTCVLNVAPAKEKDEDTTTTPLLIAGGVLLGGLALYFANRKLRP